MRLRQLVSALAVGGLAACAANGEPETPATGEASQPGYLDTAGIEQAMLDTTAYGVTEEGETVWGIYFATDGTARAAAQAEDGWDRDNGAWRAEDDALCFSNWEGWTFLNQCFRIQRQGDNTLWESVDTDFWNQAMLVDGNPDSL